MKKCSFCQEDCDGKLILINTDIGMKDGSDVVVCDTCLRLYVNSDYDSLSKRLRPTQPSGIHTGGV